MQFGVVLHVTAAYASWDNLLGIARKAEQLGYDSVWVSDHLISPDGRPYGLEAWTALSALASSTRRIRLGTYVLCNQFRHPSLLAKMAATLDNVSGGRLDLGIGAGWLKDEHLTFGFGWDKHAVRIERLRETVEILMKLWTENHVTYQGKFFQLRKATLEPRPLQRPHPPLWVGGNSGDIKKVVADLADGWIPVLPTPRQLEDGARQIKEKMRRLGRKPERLRVAYGGSGCALIAQSESTVRRLAEPLMRSMGKRKCGSCIIGTPKQCIQKIEEYERAGAQQIVAGFYDFPSLEGMKLFAESVIPQFKMRDKSR